MNSVFIALFLFRAVSGLSSGAPTQACTSMTPDPTFHGSPQNGASPFRVTVDKPYYKAGKPVQVTISGTDMFKGIMVQAREVGKNTPIGTFSDSLPLGVQQLKCSNMKDTVTHKQVLSLNTITLNWLPPTDVSGMGNVYFLATVVKKKVVFWVKLASPELSKMEVISSMMIDATKSTQEVMNAMTTADAMTPYVTATPQSTQAINMNTMYASTYKDGDQMSTYSMVPFMKIDTSNSTYIVESSSKVLSTTNPPTSSTYAFSPILSPLLLYEAFLLLLAGNTLGVTF